jgi:osmotically-inducible protein OsmY
MNRPKSLYALTGALILVGVLPGCATYGPGDAKITANVQAQLVQHPELGPPNLINVQTQDHVVYLNGMVSTGLQRNIAEAVAYQADDVVKVQNLVSITK